MDDPKKKTKKTNPSQQRSKTAPKFVVIDDPQSAAQLAAEDVVDRRSRCKYSFLEFCKTYFPHQFETDFAADQIELIDHVQRLARGDDDVIREPLGRGRGYTTILIAATIYLGAYAFVRTIAHLRATIRDSKWLSETVIEWWSNSEGMQADFQNVYLHQVRDRNQQARLFVQFVHDSETEVYVAFVTPQSLPRNETFDVQLIDF